jgi:hypothetical protein
MTKLDTNSVSLAYPSDTHLGRTRRLIVLVPAEADYSAVTHRICELAHALESDVLLISLCANEMQEPSIRRQLITMAAMVADGKVSTETRLDIGSNWVNAARSELQEGDVLACFAEQRAGLLHRPLSQILQANLKAPIYILSDLSSEDLSESNLRSQILGWIGSIAIIIGAFLLQIRITSLAESWAQTTFMILSVLGEIWLIWGWNKLFS